MGNVKITFLTIIIVCLFTFSGYFLAGESGMLIALVLSVSSNFEIQRFSDQILLKKCNAKEINQNSSPEIYSMVKDITNEINHPNPAIYSLEKKSQNVFANGRASKLSVVTVRRGVLKMLNSLKIIGAIVHEISHILNRYMLILTLPANLAGTTASISTFFMSFRAGHFGCRRINFLVMIAIFGRAKKISPLRKCQS